MFSPCARWLGAGLCLGAAALASAQTPDPSRLGYAARPLAVPSLLADPPSSPSQLSLEDENVFAPESPGDDDLGQQLILKEAPKNRWMSAQVDTFLFWSDNAANLSEGEKDDFFWGGRVSLTAQPRLSRNLYGDIMVSQQFYRYDRLDFLDYEYLEASAGLISVEPRLADSILYIQGYFNRMTTDSFSEDIVNSWSVRAGIQKTILFDRRNTLHINLMGDWDLDTDVAELERYEYVADVGYTFKLMRGLMLGASYRFTYFDYQEVDRADVLNLLGVNLVWSPRKWIDVYLAASYSFNNSDVDVFDYEAGNVGGGGGVRIRF